MYILNAVNAAAVRNAVKAIALTALIVCVFVATYCAAIVVLPLIVAALTAVLSVVVTVSSTIVHAAVYALVTLAAVAVRMVVVVALVRALPMLWRAAVALWAHRDGLLIAGKALCYAGVVISVFIVALVWLPVVMTACCTVLPQAGIVAGVFGGVVAMMKVG